MLFMLSGYMQYSDMRFYVIHNVLFWCSRGFYGLLISGLLQQPSRRFYVLHRSGISIARGVLYAFWFQYNRSFHDLDALRFLVLLSVLYFRCFTVFSIAECFMFQMFYSFLLVECFMFQMLYGFQYGLDFYVLDVLRFLVG